MGGLSSLVLLLSSIPFSSAAYTRKEHYQGANFFNGFTFFTDPDPTHGFVKYVDQATAKKNGLISNTASTAYMGVDYTSVLKADGSKGGRQSVRITSKAKYNSGLFIADIAHIPGGICGTWPAWWTFGPNWPNQGEIDIMEGVNRQYSNLMALHTGDGCTVNGKNQMGTLTTGNCYQFAPGQSNSGCTTRGVSPNSYSNFNNLKGGVYAMEWQKTGIKVWHFPRGSIPADISKGAPDPAKWGNPAANFGSATCDITKHFKDHNMVFDTTFCGDWAGGVWASDANCKAKASSCAAYVAGKPADFKNAYWSINYVSVYQQTSPPAVNRVAQVASANAPAQSPVASSNPEIKALVANNAAGATGQPLRPGQVVPDNVAPVSLAQEPAVLNGTVV
ncbi:MAG: hypothetical protein M1831_001426 [Alyxoria varia]|nr:MAG: hypothetical protein M1831_001426 [Alyxoria varia]